MTETRTAIINKSSMGMIHNMVLSQRETSYWQNAAVQHEQGQSAINVVRFPPLTSRC